MAATLFRENSSQRFCRESHEMWEKVKTKESVTNIKRENSSLDRKLVNSNVTTAEPQPVRTTKVATKKEQEIFPKKVKSKFVKTKPALWEKNIQNTKTNILKKN